MTHPFPKPALSETPSKTRGDFDLSKNYWLSDKHQIHVKDICVYIKKISEPHIVIDCSRSYPLPSNFGFLIDLIRNTVKHITSIEENVCKLKEIHDKILNSYKTILTKDYIYEFFDTLKELKFKVLFIIPNFHHIAHKIEEFEFHILYQQAFENNAFNLWFLSCNMNLLSDSSIKKDIWLICALLTMNKCTRFMKYLRCIQN